MKRILFFDLDGTLWNREEKIPKSACEAIRKARANGHEVWINTGRGRAFVDQPQLFELGIDGAVTGAGTMVECRLPGQLQLSIRWRENRICQYDEIPMEQIAETVEWLIRHRIYFILEGRDYLYCDTETFGDDPFVTRVVRKMGKRLLPVTGNEGNWSCVKLSCDLKDVIRRDEALEWLTERYEVFAHNEKIVEFVPMGHTKGTGVMTVCRELGIPPENAVAFGDGRNDLEMFEAAGTAVAMGNGTDIAKMHADIVALPYDADGIREALKSLGII